MAEVSISEFLREYSIAINRGNAAVFAGAGLSRASGFVDWPGLLRDLACDIGLDVQRETDLTAVAQFHVNSRRNRSSINDVLVDKFARDAEPNEALRLVAQLPIQTYWTTNYDSLIETALRDAERKPDVKLTPQNLAVSVPDAVTTVYKMHGDIGAPHDAVVTKDDYETYDHKRRLFSEALQGELVSKTFLFLGFSFTDPNIDSILARIRVLLGENQRRHFVILRRPKPSGTVGEDFDYTMRKFKHRVDDLQRYSIHSVIVDEFEQVPALLAELKRLNQMTRVFVSGAAHDSTPLGQTRLSALCRRLGDRIVSDGFTLVTGFGLGVGGAVVFGAAEALERGRNSVKPEQLRFRPFPQEIPPDQDRQAFYTNYRTGMLRDVGVIIFVAGNREGPQAGSTEQSPGVIEEFRIAVGHGACPIPIATTGHAARDIWAEVTNTPEKFYANVDVAQELSCLGADGLTDENWIDAVFAIIDKFRRPRI